MDNLDNGQFANDIAPQPKRPNLLTTACILTWICCSFLLITTVWGLIMNTPEKQMENIEEMRKFNPEMADKMEEAIANQGGTGQIINNALGLLAMGLSSLGAYLMWQLKKKGFYIYLAGEFLPYLGFFFAGESMGAAFNVGGMSGSAMMAMAAVILLVSDSIFIVMYAVNLKHMNNN